MMAIIAPLDRVIDPESDPAAPASESPTLLPGVDPTSPGAGPVPKLAIGVKELGIHFPHHFQVVAAMKLPTPSREKKPRLQTFLESMRQRK
jgi:hypothetical protein